MAIAASNREVFTAKQGGDITFRDMVDERDALGESQIQKLFAGSTVLITGGTGFLGKLLVEKLLRSCPEIRRLYLLVRPKKNKDITKRLQEQFDDVLYDRLRKQNPDFIQKIELIEGDVSQLQLGMKEEDRNKIIDEVEIIFHGAATVRFDESIKVAVEINVRGSREMLLLARACSKLKAMVHVSTAYSNCPIKVIDEKFYESPLPGDKLIDLVETMDEKTLNNITPGMRVDRKNIVRAYDLGTSLIRNNYPTRLQPVRHEVGGHGQILLMPHWRLIGDYPNTYVYTKACAEDIVLKYSKGLPVALFRPSIVVGTAKEPIAGWIDNVYGPTGVVVGAGIGLLHVLNCSPKAVADLVPGDMVVNACIAAAWKTAKDSPGNHEDAPPPDLAPTVYNYVSSEQKPITWERFMKYNEVYGFEVPSIQALYYYLFFLTPSTFLYNFICFTMHWIPAYIVDGICTLIGKKPILKKAYTKIEKFSAVISYFALREWKFYNQNTQKLFGELCDADKHIYDFDISCLEWSDYFFNYVRGIRVYLIKDPIETINDGIRKYKRLRYVHYFITSVLVFIMLRLLWALLGLIFGF